MDMTGTPPNNRVSRGDQLADRHGHRAGTGLEVLLEFGPQIVRVT